MKLIYTEGERAGHEVKVGDKFEKSGDWTVVDMPEPHKPGSEGKVYVRQAGHTHTADYYVSVIGARWIDRTDRNNRPVYRLDTAGQTWLFDNSNLLCQALQLLARCVTTPSYEITELDFPDVSPDDVIYNDVHVFRSWLGLPVDGVEGDSEEMESSAPTREDEQSRDRLVAMQEFIRDNGSDDWMPNMVAIGDDGTGLFARSGGEVNVFSSPDGLTTDLYREFGDLLNGAPTIRLQVADVRGDSALVDLNWHEATRIAEAILKLTSIKANG